MKTSPPSLDQLSREELLERIRELEALVAELRAEIERLEREGRRQAAPFSKRERKAKPKKSGRKAGKGPFRYRTRPEPEEITAPATPVPVTLPCCPECGGGLEEERVDLCWRTELPEHPRPEVKEYRVSVARCQGCGHRVRGTHPDVAPDQRGATAHRLGPRLLATAHVLHHGFGVTVRKVPGLLRELWGVRLTQGALTQAALREAGRGAGEAYVELRDEIPEAPAVHTDPTGWRVRGEAAQLAVFATPHTSLYQILPHFRQDEVLAVLGEGYQGIISTDRGRVFEGRLLRDLRQQKCLAHLLRNVSQVLERKKGRARDFGLRLQALLRAALGLHRAWRVGEVTEGAYWVEVERLERELTHHLRRRSLRDPDNQRLLNGIGTQHDRGHVLRFLHLPADIVTAGDSLDGTNNHAERELRPAVIARKVSHCSKTWAGAGAYSIFTSLIRTSRKRGVPSLTDALLMTMRTGRAPPLPTPESGLVTC